ncbi:MAG: hypothetical protein F9K32_20155 [Desulfobulbaceae bacterium]|nr:MAG: hypothetical protein F9K32_20155 [Desulfobulbaceae bacterium]
MKKAIAALLVGASMSAMASGPYDGLYQSTVNERSFILVNQNGPLVLAANYYAIPTDGSIGLYFGNNSVKPPLMYIWDAYMGPIDGNTGNVTGLAASGACNVTMQFVFQGQTLNWSIAKAEQTQLGASQSVNCVSAFPAGASGQAKRVF